MNGFDYNPRLVRHPLDFERRTLLNAKATIKFNPSKDDPWFEVVKMIGAYYAVQTIGMLKAKVVAEVDQNTFIPYSFLKWDEENI